MIRPRDLYAVISAILPLYVPMSLGYSSVRWLKIFDHNQCKTINQLVSTFTIPFFIFDFISQMNPYTMNFPLIAADALSKIAVLLALLLWAKFSTRGSLDWAITLFSLITLPNTVIVGAPLIASMYGDDMVALLVQIVVAQFVIWINFVLVLFEFRAARTMLKPNFNKIICDDFHQPQNSDEKRAKLSVNPRRSDENVGQLDDPDDQAGHWSDQQIDEEIGPMGDPPNTPNKASLSGEFASRVSQSIIEVEAVEIMKHSGSLNHDAGSKKNLDLAPASAQFKQAGEEGPYRLTMQVENATANGERNENSAVSLVMLIKIARTIWRKLARNPTLYANFLSLIWALLSHRFNIKKPPIMDNSVKLLANAGLGMTMFNLGLFMSLQPRIIACGTRLAAYGVIARFIVGPAVMAIASIAVGLRGTILKVAIIQASLPQAIITFVFANEYNVHPNVLSTAVIFGMIVSVPINILYYIILGFF